MRGTEGPAHPCERLRVSVPRNVLVAEITVLVSAR
jgi:hypothetical protein